MPRDSIVEEIRAIREGLAKAHGYDVKKIVQALQDQAEGSRTLITLAPKRLRKKQAGHRAGVS